MSTIAKAPSTSGTIAAPRVVSIDIFRGLTMAVMIFVNELSGVRGLPWWTYHALADVDVMTYVDMVFPFFLFSVGMSLPLSVSQRKSVPLPVRAASVLPSGENKSPLNPLAFPSIWRRASPVSTL